VDERSPSAAHVAREIGTTPATLRRWQASGLIPQYDGAWTPSAVAHARLVARMRERGHALDQIRAAGDSGRLGSATCCSSSRPAGRPTRSSKRPPTWVSSPR